VTATSVTCGQSRLTWRRPPSPRPFGISGYVFGLRSQGLYARRWRRDNAVSTAVTLHLWPVLLSSMLTN
jgi:hypothetical protein